MSKSTKLAAAPRRAPEQPDPTPVAVPVQRPPMSFAQQVRAQVVSVLAQRAADMHEPTVAELYGDDAEESDELLDQMTAYQLDEAVHAAGLQMTAREVVDEAIRRGVSLSELLGGPVVDHEADTQDAGPSAPEADQADG